MNRILVRGKLFNDWRVVMVKGSEKFQRENGPAPKIPMAVNTVLDRYGGSNTYIDISMFGKIAEKALNETVKGDQVEIKGFLKQNVWTDKETNKRRSKLSMTVKAFAKLDQTKEWDIGPNELAPWDDGAEEE